MDPQTQQLLSRLFNKYFKPELPDKISQAVTSQKVPDISKTQSGWIAVLGEFLGACGIGVPTGAPTADITGIHLGNPTDITVSDLGFPGGDDISFSFSIGGYDMDGNWKFSQPCIQFLPPVINNACATTSAANLMATANGADISDHDLDYLREFRDKIQKTKLGAHYVSVYYENEDELQDLLDNNDDVKQGFEDAQALKLLDNILQVAQDVRGVTLEEDAIANAFPQLSMVLMQNGSANLRKAVLYLKSQVPQYQGMSLKEIMAKLENSDDQAAIADEVAEKAYQEGMKTYNLGEPQPTRPVPKAKAKIDDCGCSSDWSPLSPRTISGDFDDNVKNTTVTITGSLAFSGPKPVFTTKKTSATVGDVDVSIIVTSSVTTASQAIGMLLANLFASWFGPGKTQDAIITNFEYDSSKDHQPTAFAQTVTDMINNAIQQNWPF